jgi:hypothetical protein
MDHCAIFGTNGCNADFYIASGVRNSTVTLHALSRNPDLRVLRHLCRCRNSVRSKKATKEFAAGNIWADWDDWAASTKNGAVCDPFDGAREPV